MHIEQITATPVMIPYNPPVGPYVGRRGGDGTLGASALVVKIETDSGLVGWGEGTGTLETDPNPILAGYHAADIENILALLEGAGLGRGSMSGIEMALWDLVGKEAEMPLCRLLGGQNRTQIDFCACMGLKEPSDSAATAREYVDRWGFTFLKTKAGSDAEQDLRIAEAVQEEVGDIAVLRPDANAGYTPEQAETVMQQMHALGIRYFEDPCASEEIETLARIRLTTGMVILVNMGVTTPESVRSLLVGNAADFLMPDTPASGGLSRVKKVAAVAEAWNVPCLMHCSHDLGLKTAAVAHLAAATPNFSGPNDTCYHGLTDDILTEPLTFENGSIRVPTEPGLGVEVDEDKIEAYRV